MGHELSLRDLIILYVIAVHNRTELQRLGESDIPRQAWPSAFKAATITTLWGKNPESGLLNQFIAEHQVIEPIKSAEIIYRSLRDKLWPTGLIYSSGDVPENQFAPTRAGFKVVDRLEGLGSPAQWPDRLPIEAGAVQWNYAKFPYNIAYKQS